MVKVFEKIRGDCLYFSAKEQHAQAHTEATQALLPSYAKTNEQMQTIGSSLRSCHDALSVGKDEIMQDIKPLATATELFQADQMELLGQTTDTIRQTELREDTSTGETPRKQVYPFPTSWNRTKPHSSLIKPKLPLSDINNNVLPDPSLKSSMIKLNQTESENLTPQSSKADMVMEVCSHPDYVVKLLTVDSLMKV